MKKLLLILLLTLSTTASAQIITVDSGTYDVTNSTVLDHSCRRTVPVSCQVNDVGEFSYPQVQDLNLVDQALFIELEPYLVLGADPYWLANAFTSNSITCEFHSELTHSTGRAVCGSSFLGVVTATRINAVPVPAALWLFISGLLGLVGVSRGRGK